MKPTLTLGALLLCTALCPSALAAPEGWQFHQGAPGKPAVLLIHGLAASSRHWTEPKATWSIKHFHYDHGRDVKAREGDKKGETHLGVTSYPMRAGLESVRISPVDSDAGKAGSFWAYLVKQGYTVATWDQIPCMETDRLPSAACRDSDTFEPAYRSAQAALSELARSSGDAPIALLGHSRGGLIARQLLKQRPQAGAERVRWLVTLHSPHQGSGMATMGVSLQKKLDQLDDLVALAGMAGARELANSGAVLSALRQGEGKPAGVRVVTFGGTSPRVALVHAYVYDAQSANPKSKEWRSTPHRLLDFPADLGLAFAETKPGGDLLVTDTASRLPWEELHHTHKLNHAEVLWSRKVQQQVDAVLATLPGPHLGQAAPGLGAKDLKAASVEARRQTTAFQASGLVGCIRTGGGLYTRAVDAQLRAIDLEAATARLQQQAFAARTKAGASGLRCSRGDKHTRAGQQGAQRGKLQARFAHAKNPASQDGHGKHRGHENSPEGVG